ncbi:MAG: type I-F CRISPR-associated protein Csy3 [Gammaproteobacteria bacterium]|nr:type I-F CRISPR-associated protein Csy3 [Gammaproteobacteria bacterium]
MPKETIKTASVLAFERKLDPSDGLLLAGTWDQRDQEWQPVKLREKAVRGTISNRLKAQEQDPAKLDASIQNPNLQSVDIATLPSDTDTLRLNFTLRVLGGAGRPCACNDAAYQQALKNTVESYVEQHGFGELAQRYACNLANGRFLWRNRLGAEAIEVQVRHVNNGDEKRWTFDSLAFSLRDFVVPEQFSKAIEELKGVIQEGLSNKQPKFLEVTADARMSAGQEVFPSQELILDQGRGNQKGRKSKILYEVDETAAMHSQKIGNALRTIDTWYPEAEDENLGPIAVEPYGSVTSRGSAYRQPKQKLDFYNLLDAWVIKGQVPSVEQQHFVMATLIRGGVFGESQG